MTVPGGGGGGGKRVGVVLNPCLGIRDTRYKVMGYQMEQHQVDCVF